VVREGSRGINVIFSFLGSFVMFCWDNRICILYGRICIRTPMCTFLLLIKSNSNSLANQLGIHLLLAKQEKLASNSLANQLGKNRNLAKFTSPRAYMRTWIVVAISVSH
jgi:hypothetical protein